jgi:hypothetical protein
MCLICVEFEKERMTVAEARRALGEMAEALEPEHIEEVEEMIEETAREDEDED